MTLSALLGGWCGAGMRQEAEDGRALCLVQSRGYLKQGV